MDAFPAIAACLQRQHTLEDCWSLPWELEDDRRLVHECVQRQGVSETYGPNLMLWTGRMHTPVLTIKE
jgi:hypothetical protein